MRAGQECRAGWLGLFAAALAACSGCLSLPVARDSDRAVQCRRDLKQAERLRGLPLTREVGIGRESPAELRAALTKELEKAENRAFLKDTDVLLKELRVLKPADDLNAIYLNLMTEQVAAYYDPEAKRVAYVEGNGGAETNSAAFPGMERFVYVHEFCHAVEDSHFDLDRLAKESMSDFDRNLALTSLVEGDAVLVGLDSVFAELPVNTATPLGGLVVGLMGQLDISDAMEKEMGGCPAFLAGTLVRPYLDGGVFVNRMRREAGWGRVDEAYRERVPVTTAEILYPERRYLRPFRAVRLRPAPAAFGCAVGSVATNTLGAMGMALWLSGEESKAAGDFGFLKGWMGDRLFLVRDSAGGVAETVWLSCWDRPYLAWEFARHARRRLQETFGSAPWTVKREGKLVAIVWAGRDGASLTQAECEKRANMVLAATAIEPDKDVPNGHVSALNDLPWPLRFPRYEGYSGGMEVLGGHAVDVCVGSCFSRFNLADGLLVRAESNPDRHYYGLCGGMVRHVRDERSAFTFWKIPLLVAWFSRKDETGEKYRWRVLWGLAAYGDERSAHILLMPVWHAEKNK